MSDIQKSATRIAGWNTLLSFVIAGVTCYLVLKFYETAIEVVRILKGC